MTYLLDVIVMTPKEVLYSGKALAVSSQNSQGKFDILAMHANFITIVENKDVTVLKPDKTKANFSFKQAIIYQYHNKVSVFAEPSTYIS